MVLGAGRLHSKLPKVIVAYSANLSGGVGKSCLTGSSASLLLLLGIGAYIT